MAYGDIGGAVTELIITCRTPLSGDVNITKGDAVSLVGGYTVDNVAARGSVIFGQSLCDSKGNGETIPVKVRGVCIFRYTGLVPIVDGVTGVVMSEVEGEVRPLIGLSATGINLETDIESHRVHVLM